MASDPSSVRRRPVIAPLLLAAACLCAPSGDARSEAAPIGRDGAKGQAPDAARPEAHVFADRVATAWNARDLDGWLALWRFGTTAERTDEEALARDTFSTDETKLTFLRMPTAAAASGRFTIEAQVFTASEPRGRVEYWRLTAHRADGQWALVSREYAGQVDGLVHLSLDSGAFRVRDATLKLEDFELRMESGTLFQTSASVGPTGLLFVGKGRVLVTPGPPAEREQLRQYSGHPTLDVAVTWAFARLHPADF